MTTLYTRRVLQPDGREAIAAVAGPDTSGEDLVAALRLPPARGVVALNGGTEELDDPIKGRLARVLSEGLAGVAGAERLTLVTGGTDAGIFALLGAGLARGKAPACVGVAVLGLVDPGPNGPPRAEGDARVPLEPHHSHFVLVEGNEWGDETPVLLALLSALDLDGPDGNRPGRRCSAAVIAGGGEVTRREALGHARAGRPFIALEGSGRFADELSAWAHGDPTATLGELGEILEPSDVEVVRLADGPEALAEAVRRCLGMSTHLSRRRRRRVKWSRPALLRRLPRLRPNEVIGPIVPGSARHAHPALAEDFALLDRELVPAFRRVELEARRMQNQFWMEQLLLIVGGAALTILGALQTALTGQAWPGVAEAVIGGVISAVALRARELAAREDYMQSRLKAERLKGEYFLYLGRVGDYASAPEPGHLLRRRVVEIETDAGP